MSERGDAFREMARVVDMCEGTEVLPHTIKSLIPGESKCQR